MWNLAGTWPISSPSACKAIGMYTYYDRLTQGLQQLMAGARKFALQYITRDDIMSLTRDAEEVSGIPYIMDTDAEKVDEILSK